MESLVKKFKALYIDEKSINSPVSQRLQKLFPQDAIHIVKEAPYQNIRGTLSSEQFSKSKTEIFVTEHNGHFFKRCPGSRPGLTCCNYFVLNLGLQCDMNCSYCYLQSFINSPLLTIYSNLDKALFELEQIAQDNSDRIVRVGTGETIDSLSLDPLTHYSRDLIAFFKKYPLWKLEFKTKSHYVDQFLDCEHGGNVIVSWSLNPQYVIAKEEHQTASLNQRLEAALKCRDKGYLLSFHIDPVIWHPEWKENYSNLVDQITDHFSPKDLYAISIGALRFQPEQRFMMKERFGLDSLVTQSEMFPSADGKLRYDKTVRKEMFEFIVKRFKEKSEAWNIFLCMETPETWLKGMDGLPKQHEGLDEFFDHKVTTELNKSIQSLQ